VTRDVNYAVRFINRCREDSLVKNRNSLIKKLASIYSDFSRFSQNHRTRTFMTDEDDLMTMRLEEMLETHPEIIEHWAELDAAVEKVKRKLWLEFLKRLRPQLRLRNIELGDRLYRLFGSIMCHLTPSDPGSSFVDGKKLRCLLVWNPGIHVLKISVHVHAKSHKAATKIWDRHNGKEYPRLRRRLRAKYHDRYAQQPCYESPTCPLNHVDLSEGFMTSEFVGKYVRDSRGLDKVVECVAELIGEYVAFVLEKPIVGRRGKSMYAVPKG